MLWVFYLLTLDTESYSFVIGLGSSLALSMMTHDVLECSKQFFRWGLRVSIQSNTKIIPNIGKNPCDFL